jgi:hypothetical protein
MESVPSSASTNSESFSGAMLTVVEIGSPAELAGLRSGDVVFACDNHPIESAEMFRDYIRGCRPDSVIQITSLRGLKRQTHSIQIAARPRQGGFPAAAFINSKPTQNLEEENTSLKNLILDLQRRVESLEKRLESPKRP